MLALAMRRGIIPVLDLTATADPEYEIVTLCPDQYTRSQPSFSMGDHEALTIGLFIGK